jgi:hypothetical protein
MKRWKRHTPPPGWRFLELGEYIWPDDLQWDKKRWVKHRLTLWVNNKVEKCRVGFFIRLLPPPKPTKPKRFRTIDDA